MAGHFKNMALVSLSTLGSRFLGLARDMLAAAVFSVGIYNSAFNFAFTLPNMFRRMLGEGALTSALIPVMNGVHENGQKQAAFSFFNRILTRTFLVLVALTILMCVLAGAGVLFISVAYPNDALSEALVRWRLGLLCALALMPYMILVCLAAVQAAMLNVLRCFAIPALSQVWLNLSMIISLGGFGLLFASSAEGRMAWMCAGVLFGGCLQVLIPGADLWRKGWRPRFDLSACAGVLEVQRLIVPGLIGAAVLQINVVVSRLLAMAVDNSAVTLLYLSSRLLELPLGLFTVAAVTVLFPTLSTYVARDDHEGFVREYSRGLRLIWAIAVPATVGLIILREPIVDLLFRWGKFSEADVSLLTPVIFVSALCMPFYSLSTFATRGLHSFKDMKTPMKIAGGSFLVNLAASLLLMWHFGAVGLAGANLLSAIFQSFMLQYALTRGRAAFDKQGLSRSIRHVAVAAIAMCLFVGLGWMGIVAWVPLGKVADLVGVVVLIPLGAAFYFWVLCACGFEDKALLRQLFDRLFVRFLKTRRAAN